MKLSHKIIFFLVIVMAVVSCVKEKNFPPQPVITFDQFVTYSGKNGDIDSADCTIKFTDGDGDVGIMKGDLNSPDNLKMKYLYKSPIDGLFHPVDAIDSTTVMDTLFFSYRIPNLTPNGQYKALDGSIKVKLRTSPVFYPGHHIVKFEITLLDRAGHLSNRVSTNEINIP
ncbi:MAG: hypothetical protein ABI315_12765 [Bacteroidia bacterium]